MKHYKIYYSILALCIMLIFLSCKSYTFDKNDTYSDTVSSIERINILKTANLAVDAIENQDAAGVIKYTNFIKYLRYFDQDTYKYKTDLEILNEFPDGNYVSTSSINISKFTEVNKIPDDKFQEFIAVINSANIDTSNISTLYEVSTKKDTHMYIIETKDNQYYLDFFYSEIYKMYK